jgi:hypothetical protein
MSATVSCPKLQRHHLSDNSHPYYGGGEINSDYNVIEVYFSMNKDTGVFVPGATSFRDFKDDGTSFAHAKFIDFLTLIVEKLETLHGMIAKQQKIYYEKKRQKDKERDEEKKRRQEMDGFRAVGMEVPLLEDPGNDGEDDDDDDDDLRVPTHLKKDIKHKVTKQDPVIITVEKIIPNLSNMTIPDINLSNSVRYGNKHIVGFKVRINFYDPYRYRFGSVVKSIFDQFGSDTALLAAAMSKKRGAKRKVTQNDRGYAPIGGDDDGYPDRRIKSWHELFKVIGTILPGSCDAALNSMSAAIAEPLDGPDSLVKILDLFGVPLNLEWEPDCYPAQREIKGGRGYTIDSTQDPWNYVPSGNPNSTIRFPIGSLVYKIPTTNFTPRNYRSFEFPWITPPKIHQHDLDLQTRRFTNADPGILSRLTKIYNSQLKSRDNVFKKNGETNIVDQYKYDEKKSDFSLDFTDEKNIGETPQEKKRFMHDNASNIRKFLAASLKSTPLNDIPDNSKESYETLKPKNIEKERIAREYFDSQSHMTPEEKRDVMEKVHKNMLEDIGYLLDGNGDLSRFDKKYIEYYKNDVIRSQDYYVMPAVHQFDNLSAFQHLHVLESVENYSIVGIVGNIRIRFLWYISTLSALIDSPMKFNLFVYGPPASGKTVVANGIQKSLIPGTQEQVSARTSRSDVVSENQDRGSTVWPDASATDLNVDPIQPLNGKKKTSMLMNRDTAGLCDQLTSDSGISRMFTGLRQDKNTGHRSQDRFPLRKNGAHMVITNIIYRHLPDAFASRLHPEHMDSLAYQNEILRKSAPNEKQKEVNEILTRSNERIRKAQLLFYFTSMLINTNILPEVCLTLANEVVSRFVIEASKTGTRISIRDFQRIFIVIRVQTIRAAINKVFFTEFSPFAEKEAKEGEKKRFEFEDLFILRPHLFATMEIIIFSLTLLSFIQPSPTGKLVQFFKKQYFAKKDAVDDACNGPGKRTGPAFFYHTVKILQQRVRDPQRYSFLFYIPKPVMNQLIDEECDQIEIMIRCITGALKDEKYSGIEMKLDELRQVIITLNNKSVTVQRSREDINKGLKEQKFKAIDLEIGEEDGTKFNVYMVIAKSLFDEESSINPTNEVLRSVLNFKHGPSGKYLTGDPTPTHDYLFNYVEFTPTNDAKPLTIKNHHHVSKPIRNVIKANYPDQKKVLTSDQISKLSDCVEALLDWDEEKNITVVESSFGKGLFDSTKVTVFKEDVEMKLATDFWKGLGYTPTEVVTKFGPVLASQEKKWRKDRKKKAARIYPDYMITNDNDEDGDDDDKDDDKDDDTEMKHINSLSESKNESREEKRQSSPPPFTRSPPPTPPSTPPPPEEEDEGGEEDDWRIV